MGSVVDRLRDGLIVSCQPVIGGPLDRTEFVVGFALAAEAGGAAGLRIEGLRNVEAVRAATGLPIIGIVKREDPDWPIIITATSEDVVALARAGADIIAFDATMRPRPQPVAKLIDAIHGAGAVAMADISVIAEARGALAAGADIVGTTLSGYVGGPVPDVPDLDLVRECVRLGGSVFAEGQYRTAEQVRAAIEAGATAVVVGSAITRPEHITSWFADAIRSAADKHRHATAAARGG